MIVSMDHTLGGEIRLVGNPIKMDGLSEEDFTSPPTLNQHEHEILCELLGYSEDKVNMLRQEEQQHVEERLRHVRKFW
jgi:CoA:oxalate CoA-transferase